MFATPHPARAAAVDRRAFLRRAGVLGAGVLAAPSLLAACTSVTDPVTGPSAGSTPGTSPLTSSGLLRVANWPYYMDGVDDAGARLPGDDTTLPRFEKATGLRVDYRVDVEDNVEFFDKVKPALESGADCGYDLFVVSDFMVAKMIDLGWLAELDRAQIPNARNLDPSFEATFDPGNAHSLPYLSGYLGLVYDKTKVARPVTSVEDLFDPALAGRVLLLSDLRDGLGMLLYSVRSSPSTAREADVAAAAAKVNAAVDAGQIAGFTGGDYDEALRSGEVVLAQVYSGDFVGLKQNNPNLEFVVPVEGTSGFVDNLVIPRTSANVVGAHRFLDYLYDPANIARIVAATQFPAHVSGYIDALREVAPDVAASPLVDIPAETEAKIDSWRVLKPQEQTRYTEIYEQVTSRAPR